MGNLAVTGLMLLTFMTIHLFQFRFGDTEQFGPYFLRPPRYLINFWGILSLNLFWTGFYIFCVTVFMVHACLGWKKVVPVLGIPKLHVANVEKFGYAIFFVIGFIYISFPLFVMFSPPFAGHETDLQYP